MRIKEPKPMMEIHKIQEKIYEQDRRLTRRQRIEKTNRIAEEMVHQYGLKPRRVDKAA